MTLSLKGALTCALAAVVEKAEALCGDEPSLADPWPAIHLSRNPQEIAYLYRPGRSAGPIPAALTAALLTTWADATLALSCEPFELGAYLRAHTTAHGLASGQLVLHPSATALRAWLQHFTQTSPPPPPITAESVIATLHPVPLAERLQLSSVALLQYTHGRCYQLAHRFTTGGAGPVAPEDPTTWDIALAPQPTSELLLWRSLVALVDALAAPPALSDPNQGLGLGYRLCEAADLWLREQSNPATQATTALLLQGTTQSLAHLLQGWLQVPAPTQL